MSAPSSGSSSHSLVTPHLAKEKQYVQARLTTTGSIKHPVQSRKAPSGICDIEHTFRQVFKKQDFKGKQREIMDAAIKGMDILVIAPTGMGKSLCFQVPAVAEDHGLTVVVSPLIALMSDQVDALNRLNVRAAVLNHRTDKAVKEEIEEDMKLGHPNIRLLYVTPERLMQPRFQRILQKVYDQKELNRLVVDEAHCISEWGHDFRKDYLQMGTEFRKLFPDVPVMALTASATQKVQNDIVESLDMNETHFYKAVHSFNRVNLYYEVRYVQDDTNKKLEDILTFITKLQRRKGGDDDDEEQARAISGIVYCRARQTCDQVAHWLRGRGIMAKPFHRGLKDKDNDATAAKWTNPGKHGDARVDCIVATVAFGMGIDMPSVRYVVHFDLPTSFEGLYQEEGRAGRDGHVSRCVLYYSREDAYRVQQLVARGAQQREAKWQPHMPPMSQRSHTSAEKLLSYCESTSECRHLAICRYFGEVIKPEDKLNYCDKFCDVCKDPQGTKERAKVLMGEQEAFTQVARQDPECYDSDEGRSTGGTLTDSDDDSASTISRAPPPSKLPGFGKASSLPNAREPEVFGIFKKRPLSRNTSLVQPADPKIDVPLPPEKRPRLEPIHAISSEPNIPVQEDWLPSPPLPDVDDLFGDPFADQSEMYHMQREDSPIPQPKPPAPPPKKPVLARSTSAISTVRKPMFADGPIVQTERHPVRAVSTSFKAPFKDPSRDPNYDKNSLHKSTSTIPSGSSDDIEMPKFKLEPSDYEKAIGKPLREEAIKTLHRLLVQALLEGNGRRTRAHESSIFNRLEAASKTPEQKRKAILKTILQMEQDMFWSVKSAEGYRGEFSIVEKAMVSMVESESWISELLPGAQVDDDDGQGRAVVVQALRRNLVKSKG